MNNRRLLLILLVTSCQLFVTDCFAEESFTITTYYPSPYGSYNELTTTGNTYLATSSGNVGIGIQTPSQKLQVNGNISASNGYMLGTNNSGIKVRYGQTAFQQVPEHSSTDFTINYSGFTTTPFLVCTSLSNAQGDPTGALWIVTKSSTSATVRVSNNSYTTNVSVQWVAIGS